MELGEGVAGAKVFHVEWVSNWAWMPRDHGMCGNRRNAQWMCLTLINLRQTDDGLAQVYV